VGDRHLYPILNASPQIAVEAGNSALTAIAAMKDIPARTLATVEQALPADQTLGLDSGAAAVTDKFARRIPSVWVEDRLSGQSRFYGTYARRLAAAGRTNEAITVAWHAVNALDITERVTGKRLTSEDDLSSKAEALNVYSVALGGARQWPKALEASQEAMDIIIGLVRKNPSRHLPAAATVMANYAYALSGQGRTDEALDYSRATRDLWYLLAMKSGSGEYVESLARAAHNHANKLGEADRYDEALRHYEFAIRLREELIRHDRAVYIVDLAGSTLIHAKLALDMGHHDVALASGRRAVELLEEMVAADRGIHLPTLMGAVTNYSIMLRSAGRQSDAARYAQRSTELEEELLTSTPNTHNLAELTEEMSHLALWREQEGQFPEALEYSQRAVRLAEHLTSSESFYRPTLVRNLTVFACIRARTDRDLDAANQAADRVANILTEESPNIPQERREEFAVTYAEMFSLLGRPDDADQISRQILDNSITTKPRPPKEYTSQPELDANFHRRVADSLEYILESIQRDVSNNDEG
jgi:tetratricopeptide (TPR) repeat protein